MDKHKEFLTKLAALMKEYSAEMTAEYTDSGCECCGGSYEFEIETYAEGRKSTTISTSYLDGGDVERAIR